MQKVTPSLLVLLALVAVAMCVGCGAGGAPLEAKDPGAVTIRSTPAPQPGFGTPPLPPS